MIYIVEENLNLEGKLSVTVRSRFVSLINGYDETQRCESLRLSCDRWIRDGPQRSRHVAREEIMRETLAV